MWREVEEGERADGYGSRGLLRGRAGGDQGINMRRGLADFGPTAVETLQG